MSNLSNKSPSRSSSKASSSSEHSKFMTDKNDEEQRQFFERKIYPECYQAMYFQQKQRNQYLEDDYRQLYKHFYHSNQIFDKVLQCVGKQTHKFQTQNQNNLERLTKQYRQLSNYSQSRESSSYQHKKFHHQFFSEHNDILTSFKSSSKPSSLSSFMKKPTKQTANTTNALDSYLQTQCQKFAAKKFQQPQLSSFYFLSSSSPHSYNQRLKKIQKSFINNPHQRPLPMMYDDDGNRKHIHMIWQRGNHISTIASFFYSEQQRQDQQQKDKKHPPSKRYTLKQLEKLHRKAKKQYHNRHYQSSLRYFKLAKQYAQKFYNYEPNEITAILLNQTGVVYYNLDNQQYFYALEQFTESLQMAKSFLKKRNQEVQQWQYWTVVMQNIIYQLRRNKQTQTALKLERDLEDVLSGTNAKTSIENLIVESQHITLLLSSKMAQQNGFFSKLLYSKKNPQISQEMEKHELHRLQTDTKHIKSITQRHHNISCSIIQSSSLKGKNLLTKGQILQSIKQSVQENKHKKHTFVFSGFTYKNNSLNIQTKQYPSGQRLHLKQIFEIFMNYSEAQKTQTITFLLDCDYAGEIARNLQEQIPKMEPHYLKNRKVKIFCSSGQNDQNIHSNIYGGLLVCRYWSLRIPQVLTNIEEVELAKIFSQVNPCMIEYISRDGEEGRIQESGWSQMRKITWGGICQNTQF